MVKDVVSKRPEWAQKMGEGIATVGHTLRYIWARRKPQLGFSGAVPSGLGVHRPPRVLRFHEVQLLLGLGSTLRSACSRMILIASAADIGDRTHQRVDLMGSWQGSIFGGILLGSVLFNIGRLVPSVTRTIS